MRYSIKAFGPLALLVLLLGCERHQREPGSPPFGVVLIVIDSLRADHLSTYGYRRDTTPNLTRLADHGVVFENAMAPSSWTLPSMASIWTGMLPSRHGAGIDAKPGEARGIDWRGQPRFRDFSTSLASLPRRLRELGYHPRAFTANPLLDAGCYLGDFEQAEVAFKRAYWLTDWTKRTLRDLDDQRFFLYLHFMDVHEPIQPPDRYLRLYLDGALSELAEGAAFARYKSEVRAWSRFDSPTGLQDSGLDQFRARKIAAYDGAIRFVDEQIGAILDTLEDDDLLDDCLVICTADHGEELWDHHQIEQEAYDLEAKGRVGVGHGHTLFQELLHVLLIIPGPEIVPRRVESWVSLVDLGETILDHVSRAPDRTPLGGARSFAGALRGEALEDRMLVAEGLAYGYDLHCVIDPGHKKYIWAPYGHEKDLAYDLDDDPREKVNVAASATTGFQALRGGLSRLVRQMQANRNMAGAVRRNLDHDAIRELGYAGGGK